MKKPTAAEYRTVSNNKAAGRSKYKPHHRASGKHWRNWRAFGLHSSTVAWMEEFNTALRTYLAAADDFDCYRALMDMDVVVVEALAKFHGIPAELSVTTLALRLSARRFPGGQATRALARIEQQAERRRLMAERA